jgi:hypothetical protein
MKRPHVLVALIINASAISPQKWEFLTCCIQDEFEASFQGPSSRWVWIIVVMQNSDGLDHVFSLVLFWCERSKPYARRGAVAARNNMYDAHLLNLSMIVSTRRIDLCC